MPGCTDGLQSIELSPADETFTIEGQTIAPIQFRATGIFEDHTAQLDVTTLAWEATRTDDAPTGSIVHGYYQPFAAGGVVTIHADDGCDASGSTTATFVVDVTIGEPGDPDDWEGEVETGGASAPAFIYPSDQTRFPRNIYRQVFQWSDAIGSDDHRLVFEGEQGEITVYTDGDHPDCEGVASAGCWEALEDAWNFIASSHAGTTVEVVADTLASDGTIHRSEPITLGFSEQDVLGAIFYWSTTSAGIRRGNIADEEPEDYVAGVPSTVYEDLGESVDCVGCHTVSRDGQYMAAPTDANSSAVWVYEVSEDAPPPPLLTDEIEDSSNAWPSISPDNELVAIARRGDMWVVDRETGAFIEDVPHAIDGGEPSATHPDWHPDGSRLLYTNYPFVSTPAAPSHNTPDNAVIAHIPYEGTGEWGEPEVLVPEVVEGKTNLFPMYSPDGDWIAFTVGDGGHSDEATQLYLTTEDGDDPVELINANRIVNNTVTDGQHQNSMPTWAPPGDLHWVAFNSKRDYGIIGTSGRQQIWVAAVDVSKFGTGEDPSYPAFRIPFQGLEEDNHRAFWTLDIRETPPDPDPEPPPPECIPTGESCEPGGIDCCEAFDGCFEDGGGGYSCQPPEVD